jgi:hypothetical protein
VFTRLDRAERGQPLFAGFGRTRRAGRVALRACQSLLAGLRPWPRRASLAVRSGQPLRAVKVLTRKSTLRACPRRKLKIA